MKKLLLSILFCLISSAALAGQTPPPGSNGQFIYNSSGLWAAGTFGSGLSFSGGTLTSSGISLSSLSGVSPITYNNSTGAIGFSTSATLSNNTSGQAGTVATISGLISQGTNITITGSGTSASPYVINSSGGGAVSSVSNSDGTLTISPTTGSVVGSLNLGHANTWTAAQTFTNSDLVLLGSSTGYTTFSSANGGASNYTLTFPALTDTIDTATNTATFTNKTYDTAGTGNVFKINGTQISSISGNTAKVATASGTLTSGHCVQIDGNLNFVDAGGACTTGGGGGTVTASPQYELPYYSSAGSSTVVTGSSDLNTGASGGLTIGSPTGGNKGAGTINVAGNVYVNGSTVGGGSLTGSQYQILSFTGTNTGSGDSNLLTDSSHDFNLNASGAAYQIGGSQALKFNTADSGTLGSSIAIGPGALSGQTSSAAYNNTAVGYNALHGTMTTTATGNTAVGNQALAADTSGQYNVAIGYKAGTTITSGANNTIIGSSVGGTTLATGSGNILMGVSSGTDTATAASTNVVAIGNGAKGGSGDVNIGYNAGTSYTSDTKHNVAIGYAANSGATSSAGNVVIGYNALSVNNTGNNVVIGYNTAGSCCSEGYDVIIGSGAGGVNFGAGSSLLIGYTAGASGPGSDTTILGTSSGYNVTGANSTFVGYNSGNAVTSGASNTIIGTAVGSTTLTTGSSNILIGTSSATTTPAAASSNELNIGGMIYQNLASTGTPTVSSCASGTIDSHANNHSGTVTEGGSGGIGCVITFAGSGYTTWNHCRVVDETGYVGTNAQAITYSYTLTAITITNAQDGDKFDYECDGY